MLFDGREAAEDIFPLQRLIKHCSSFFRLRSLVGWLLRFGIVLAAKCRIESLEGVNNSYLTVNELKEATLRLVKFVQRQCYLKEFLSLQELGSFDNIGKCHQCHSRQCLRDSSLRKLSPVVVDGVLRLGGWIQRSLLPPENRHTIILPSKHHLSELIIAYYHVKVGHCGVLHTLAATREYHWILYGHAAVKRVVTKCTVCRRTFTRPGTQIMAPLPNFRVARGKPAFTCVGLDFAGPFLNKCERSLTKRCLCIFTCLASRAVYLEVAFGLDSDSFLQCFSRFCYRRLTPELLVSDNGSNFVGAERELRNGIRRCFIYSVLSKLAKKGVNWRFNPPGASHHGGVWECLIRSFRRIFSAIAQNTRLDDQVLITFATKVDQILSDRYLTPVSADSKDLLALTPNTLLKGSFDSSSPPDVFMKADGYWRSWRKVGYLANEFWNCWLKCYLPTL